MMQWLISMCVVRYKPPILRLPPPVKKGRVFWASETEPGIWHVQFSEDEYGVSPKLDGVMADTCWDAVEKAKSILLLDEYA